MDGVMVKKVIQKRIKVSMINYRRLNEMERRWKLHSLNDCITALLALERGAVR